MSSPEQEAEKKIETEEANLSVISVEDAAKASIVQSIAFAAQNDVDAWRNQNTVDLVAMGAAYAKWLENPVMSDQYEKIIEETRRSDVVKGSISINNSKINGFNDAKSERLSMSIFKTFLGNLPK